VEIKQGKRRKVGGNLGGWWMWEERERIGRSREKRRKKGSKGMENGRKGRFNIMFKVLTKVTFGVRFKHVGPA